MESGASFRISQNLFHPIGITLAANLVVRRHCGLPQHNTTKGRWIFGHVLADYSICFCSVQVRCSVGRRPIITSRKPQVNLSALIFAVVEHTIDPIVKGKGGGASGQTVVPSPGRALRRVVKLHKQEIKRRVLDGIVKMSIWDNTLGRSRDIVGS